MPSSPHATPADHKTQDGTENHQRKSSLNNIEPLNMKTTTSATEAIEQDGAEVRERHVTITTTTTSS